MTTRPRAARTSRLDRSWAASFSAGFVSAKASREKRRVAAGSEAGAVSRRFGSGAGTSRKQTRPRTVPSLSLPPNAPRCGARANPARIARIVLSGARRCGTRALRGAFLDEHLELGDAQVSVRERLDARLDLGDARAPQDAAPARQERAHHGLDRAISPRRLGETRRAVAHEHASQRARQRLRLRRDFASGFASGFDAQQVAFGGEQRAEAPGQELGCTRVDELGGCERAPPAAISTNNASAARASSSSSSVRVRYVSRSRDDGGHFAAANLDEANSTSAFTTPYTSTRFPSVAGRAFEDRLSVPASVPAVPSAPSPPSPPSPRSSLNSAPRARDARERAESSGGPSSKGSGPTAANPGEPLVASRGPPQSSASDPRE